MPDDDKQDVARVRSGGPAVVVPDHTPDHTFVCGACGAWTDDVAEGHPPCVTGDAEHLFPPAPGYPHPEWELNNAGHRYLTKIKQHAVAAPPALPPGRRSVLNRAAQAAATGARRG